MVDLFCFIYLFFAFSTIEIVVGESAMLVPLVVRRWLACYPVSAVHLTLGWSLIC